MLLYMLSILLMLLHMRVKHLNPRQGITTLPQATQPAPLAIVRVKHLNPRQGITTYNVACALSVSFLSVKHLKPRQGITTSLEALVWPTPEQG